MQKLYYQDTYLSELKTKITAVETEPYYSVTLAQTIFHPQGGGKPSDQGTINNIKIDQLGKTAAGDILHSFAATQQLTVGDEVLLQLDMSIRLYHAR